MTWRDPGGRCGNGTLVPGVRSDHSAVLWFFHPANWEMLVKVLDGCFVNDRFWVFFAAATDVEFTLTVTDRSTGAQKIYTNPLGHLADAVADTSAFATCR